MAFKGKYRPKNPNKVIGDITEITFRSSWERSLMVWLDQNSKVISWGSEVIVIPYLYKADNKIHRYFVDFIIKFEGGEILLVEVKPNKQTQQPEKKPKQSRNKYLKESLTYIKNQNKWEAARAYCEKQGWVFCVWDEFHLKSLGIKLYKPLAKLRNGRTTRRKTKSNTAPKVRRNATSTKS